MTFVPWAGADGFEESSCGGGLDACGTLEVFAGDRQWDFGDGGDAVTAEEEG